MRTHTVISAPPSPAAALWRAEKLHAGIVTDTVNLEGNPFTLPEVQTLLEGVTVGGHRLSDAEQVQNQSHSWKHLIDIVRSGNFVVDIDTACALNAHAARHEALEWGVFRDRQVTISGTDWMPPKAETLPEHFEGLLKRYNQIDDTHIKAMTLFLDMARNQYFFDGNKRTGRLMMNGVLLCAGYDVINIPFKRKLEFNQKMLRFYDSGQENEMYDFLLSCSTIPGEKPYLA